MVAGKKYNGFKIDIWSCGIILYAMLCGYLPFEDPDNEILFKKILECKLEFPDYVHGLSIDLINKILVTDPEKRITIPEIKKHPFFLQGKKIFEEEFSIAHIENTPKDEKIEKEKEEIEDKENINVLNENISSERKPKLISINLEDKENTNSENIIIKEEKIKEKEKKIEKSEKLKKSEKKEEKEEKIEIFKEIENNKEKEDKKNEIKKEDKKFTNEKKNSPQKEEKLITEYKQKEIKKNNQKNSTEQEEIYMPIKTEITDSNRFNNNKIDKNDNEK